MKLNPVFRGVLRTVAGVTLVGVGTLAVMALWPRKSRPLPTPGQPFTDYDAARREVAARLASPDPEVRPECRSFVLDHGRRTRDVYVLLHGLTNCPAQFRVFADELFANGANVLVMRLPFHGYADRLTSASARLDGDALLSSANEAIDLARGYGERVIVVGLSVSGVTAAWVAQNRADVALAVVIAPFFAPYGLPDALVDPLGNLLGRLPNFFVWWDPRVRENLPGSPFSYPRFPTHAIAAAMHLGADVFAEAAASPPQAQRILVVTSPADVAVSAPQIATLTNRWGARAERREFPVEWKIPHDCIDPKQPGGRIDLVYPQLQAWIAESLNK